MTLKNIFLVSLLALGASLISCADKNEYHQSIVYESGDFVVGKSVMVFSGDTSESTLSIKAPSVPTVTADADWITIGSVEKAQGENIYVCKVSAQANTAHADRTATITVKSGSNTGTISVTQTCQPTVIINSATALDFDGNETTFTVSYGATGDVTVTTPSWVKELSSRSFDESELSFSLYANRTGENRTGEIEIALTDNSDVKATISLTQTSLEITGGTGETAADAIKNIVVGWNLGNTMEATGGETAWGNPKTTQALIDAVKAAGWNAVRIPTAWDGHSTDGVIDADWMARVCEIIDYCLNDDMYVIVNIHWDGGWMECNCNADSQDEVNAKVADYWTQIANAMNGYDHRVLFAGANEPRNGENWGMPSKSEQGALDLYMQTFVNAVRATGGNNLTRNLIIPSWCANGWRGLDSTTMPTDQVDGHLIYEMHFYDPQAMTHNGTSKKWGYRAGYVDTNDGLQEDYVDDFFGRIKSHFVDNGYPVVIGEYGTQCWSLTEDDIMESQAYYLEYVTRAAVQNGMAPFYWDNYTPGVGSFGIMNRNSCTVGLQHFADGIMRGAYE